MKRRILATILCMAILLTVFMSAPITASAYYTIFESNGIQYRNIGGYTDRIEIIGFTAALPEHWEVPAKIDGKDVVKISAGSSRLKSVVLPDSIKEIGDYAFQDCSNLEEITFSSNLTCIGVGAFYNCTSLKEFNFPDSLETIKTSAFGGCTMLTSVKLPKNLKTLGSTAFHSCTSLKEVIINPTLEVIGSGAFQQVSSLTDIIFEERTTPLVIEDDAFFQCSGLTDFDFRWVSCVGDSAFAECTGLTSVTFPEDANVTIDRDAFKKCSGIKTVKLPDCVDFIPYGCFFECTSLESIETGRLAKIDSHAFSHCTSLKNISFALDNDITNIGSSVFYSCQYLEEISLPRIESIGDNAFMNCYSLSKITLGTNLEKLGERAFSDCYLLTEISLSKIKTLKDETFKNCISLSKVTLKEGLTKIGERVFFNCFSLEELYIPTTVETIGEMAIACFEEEGEYYVYTGFTVIGSSLSLADEYAEAYGVKYQSGLMGPQLLSIENIESGVRIRFEKFWDLNGYYRIYRKTANTSWKSLGDTTSMLYTDTTATAGTVYTYTVKFIGYDSTESSYDTDGLTITRMKAPSGTKIENTVDGAKISWNAVAGAVEYAVFVKDKDNWVNIGKTNTTSLVHTDVVSGTSYTYTIKAFDSNGAVSAYNYTGWSNKFISAPSIKNAEVTNSGVKLSWDKVSGAENYSYRIFIKNGSSWKTIDTVSGNTSTYTDKTASVGNTYTYTIRCVDSNNKYVSGYDSKGFTIRVLETPKDVSFENTYSGVVISFSEVQGAQGYRVYVHNGESWTKLGDTNTTSFVHESAVDSESYTYTVRCISEDKIFESGYNNTGFTNTYKAPEYKLGDVDGDTEISVMDATAIQLHAARVDILTEDELSRADTDKDGEVSVMDATRIQLFLARVIDAI